MSKDFNDFFKSMLDTQQDMMNSWKEIYAPKAEGQKGAFDPKLWENFMDMQKKYTGFLSDYMKDMPEMNPFDPKAFMAMGPWSDSQQSINDYFDKFKDYYNPLEMNKLFAPAVKDLFEKMIHANTYYMDLYQLWKELENANIDPVVEDLKDFIASLKEKYDMTFKDMVIPFFPKEFQDIMKNTQELMKNYSQKGEDFSAPWIDQYQTLRDLLVEGSLSDKEKLAEFFQLWKAQFDKTFGALILSPSLGMNKDVVEQQNKTFDAYMDMILLSVDFSTRIFAVQNENIDDIIEKYFEMTEKGSQPKSFNEFYKYCSDELEKTLGNYFNTPEYSKLLGQLSSVAMDYKMEAQKLSEKYLEETPLVTRSEMDSLYKTIYDLKKDIKAMKKKEEGKTASGKKAKTTTAKSK